jgi:hypothetical protein
MEGVPLKQHARNPAYLPQHRKPFGSLSNQPKPGNLTSGGV